MQVNVECQAVDNQTLILHGSLLYFTHQVAVLYQDALAWCPRSVLNAVLKPACLSADHKLSIFYSCRIAVSLLASDHRLCVSFQQPQTLPAPACMFVSSRHRCMDVHDLTKRHQ